MSTSPADSSSSAMAVEPEVALSRHSVGSAEAYLARYASLPLWARCRRLVRVGKASASPEQRIALFGLCAREAKGGVDTATYKVACELAGLTLDEAWIEATDETYRLEHDRLDGDLASKRGSGSSKEMVWECYGLLGDVLLRRGEAAQALKCYVRMRDYASTSKKSVEVCCRVATAAVEAGNWAQVSNYTAKAELIEGVDSTRFRRLRIAAGLAHLEAKRYDSAAAKFVEVVAAEVDAEEPTEGDLVSSRDVAAYACACALASFTRAELRSRCVESGKFKSECGSRHPSALTMLVAAQAADYVTALKLAADLADELRLDPVARPRADELFDHSIDKCLAQFCLPYAVVSLDQAAAHFALFDQSTLEDRLVDLIHKGAIRAKIDTVNRTLVAAEPNLRRNTFKTLLAKGQAQLRETQGLLLRMSCLEHDVVVRAPPPGLEVGAAAPAPTVRSVRPPTRRRTHHLSPFDDDDDDDHHHHPHMDNDDDDDLRRAPVPARAPRTPERQTFSSAR